MRQDGEKFLSEDILKVKAAVIGDVMMDQYVTGSVNRISPEAPVPVNLVKGKKRAGRGCQYSGQSGITWLSGFRFRHSWE